MKSAGAQRWACWSGLTVSPLVWALHHQLGSNFAFAACERGSPWVAASSGVVALGIVAATGVWSWRAWRRAGGGASRDAEQLEIFIALLSCMSAALFGLTIAVQLLADWAVPPCFG